MEYEFISLDVPSLVLCHALNTLELLVQVIMTAKFLSKYVHFFITIYGDKAYKLPDEEDIWAKQSLVVYTPIKKCKGQTRLDSADKLYSTAVSRIPQPIETLFAWIERKSGIESAGKVRSYAGLLVHVF